MQKMMNFFQFINEKSTNNNDILDNLRSNSDLKSKLKRELKNYDKLSNFDLTTISLPYRSIITNINKENYYICTLAKFKHLTKGMNQDEITQYWSSISGKGMHKNSPLSDSKYIITDDGVYRLSTHWGSVATCCWLLESGGAIEANQDMLAVGYAAFTDMSVYGGYDKGRNRIIDAKKVNVYLKKISQCIKNLNELLKSDGIGDVYVNFVSGNVCAKEAIDTLETRYGNIVYQIEEQENFLVKSK